MRASDRAWVRRLLQCVLVVTLFVAWVLFVAMLFSAGRQLLR